MHQIKETPSATLTPKTSTPNLTLTLSGFEQQPEKMHKNVYVFVLALLRHAGMVGNFEFAVPGHNGSGHTFPFDGIRVKTPKNNAVQLIVQANGKAFRYFGFLKQLGSGGMRPEVLYANLIAATENKFFNPFNPPKATPDKSNAEQTTVFAKLPEFDEANVGLALLALSQQPDAQNGVRIAQIAEIVTKEMSLGNVNPSDFGPPIEVWVANGYLEKTTSDKVCVTAKGRALFEVTTESQTATPPVPPPTVTPESKNGHLLANQTATEVQPMRDFMAGMQQLLKMAKELGHALKRLETLSGRLEEANTDIAQREKTLAERRGHRDELVKEHAELMKITNSSEHRSARDLVIYLQRTRLDTVD